jgi:2-phosphoglycerate kinase
MMNDEWGNVFWLGGSPCSGKSSVSEVLAKQFGLQIYKCDDHFDDHLQRTTPEEQPHFHRIGQMSWNGIWMRPVAELVADAIAIYREEFNIILDDLRALPNDRPILAEGTALLPDLVAPLLPRPEQAVFVVPTEPFQKTTYARREWIQGILAQCQEPEQAFANWMDRDVRFSKWVVETAVIHNLRVLTVNGSRSISENAALVANHFGFKQTPVPPR